MSLQINVTLLFLAFVTLLTSCYTYTPIEFRKVEKIKLDVEQQASGFDIRIFNPNSSGLKLRNAEAEFLLLDKSLGKAYLKNSMRISPSSENSIPFLLNLNYNNLPSLIPFGLKLLLGNSSGEINVVGSIKVRKFLWYKKINFELRQKIDKEVLKNLKF